MELNVQPGENVFEIVSVDQGEPSGRQCLSTLKPGAVG